MKNFRLFYGDGKHIVQADIICVGRDLSVNIGGGECFHIGAVALASPRESLRKDGTISATASVLCLDGHKDDLLAREAALCLAAKFQCSVMVGVGLHIDNPTKDDIKLLQKNFEKLIDIISNNIFQCHEKSV